MSFAKHGPNDAVHADDFELGLWIKGKVSNIFT